MGNLWLTSHFALWAIVLLAVFLLFGVFRQIGLLNWRLEQLMATTPSRVGRDGLKPGTSAPDFTLKDTQGTDVSLRNFASRKVLLVFIQPGCGPCTNVVPELNRLQRKGKVQVVAISASEPESSGAWVVEHDAKFPVLSQDHWQVSRSYKVFATPFAFLVDERGVIAAKGIISSGRDTDFLLSTSGNRGSHA